MSFFSRIKRELGPAGCISLVFLFTFACAFVWAPLQPVLFSGKPWRRPVESTLWGTYVPDAKTAAFIKERYPPAETFITIGSDGHCILRNIPDCWNRDWSNGTFKNVEGTWKLYTNSGIWITPERHGGICIVDLRGQNPPYVIFLYVGPEHEDNSMRFIRVPDPAPGVSASPIANSLPPNSSLPADHAKDFRQ